MAVFKCKMCGGNLEITEGMTVCECEYCGSNQTVPSADDEKKITLFTRANRLRAACEFDKAFGVYESIVAEFPEEAEAYWGLILCKYGIEYVDDPKTGKKVPTCHRSSFDGVFDDPDFEMVMEYSDALSRSVYRSEAKAIEALRVAIIEVSSKEEPYDIFICYKETDDNGDRTIDSVIAQDVYDALVEKGYKVFFSRITLEDKLGQEYEPYIFAALNSAKIMLAFGTDYEYYNAVWVKNEWSRFLSLIANGAKKTLIPCYKGLDAYDMPAEFKKLQAQDMGKVGAIQDLLRGIEKIIPREKTQIEGNKTVGVGDVVEPLLKRSFMFLEDGKWKEADEYFEKVLDIDPENSRAYLGKLMAELRVHKQEELSECEHPFDNSDNFIKAERFADESLKNKLQEINEYIYKQIEEKKKKEEEEFERIVYTLKNSQLSEGSGGNKNEQIIETEKKVSELEKVYSEYDSIQDRLVNIKNEIVSTNAMIDTLQEKKQKLGLLAMKEKKQIDLDIAQFEEKEGVLKEEQNELEKKIAGFDSKKQVADSLNSEKNKLDKLNKEVDSYEQDEIFYANAISRLKKDKKLVERVIEKEPSASIILFILGIIDNCCFGKYIQNNNGNAEPIEWMVLSIEKNKVLVISKYALECKPYNRKKEMITWETCSLRKWLNNDFLKNAFSIEEQAMIETVTVSADNNPKYSTSPGNNTKDKIFLLSIHEANKYFKTDKKRRCGDTRYASAKSSSCFCWWWLRSPGSNSNSAAGVNSDGSIYNYGYYVNYDNYAVRPAMWIKLY